jgi:hypothetical protein
MGEKEPCHWWNGSGWECDLHGEIIALDPGEFCPLCGHKMPKTEIDVDALTKRGPGRPPKVAAQ